MSIVLIGLGIILAPIAIFFFLLTCLKIWTFLTTKHYSNITELDETLKDQEQIRLLGYNTFWRPILLHIGKEEYMRERSLLLLEKLENYDIVCLEEAFQFGSSIAADFVKKAQAKGFKYCCTCRPPPIFNRQIIDSGCMILSRLPIIKTDSIRYSCGTGWDSFCAKGSVYARVQVGVKKWVHVFSTHLQASYGGVTSLDYQIRTTQARELHDFIEKNVTDDFPIFAIGDFNIDGRGGKEYDDLLKNLTIQTRTLSSTLQETTGKHEPTSCDLNDPNSGQNRSCIDFIFLYRNPKSTIEVTPKACVNKMKVEGKPYAWISDHFAVECCATLSKQHNE